MLRRIDSTMGRRPMILGSEDGNNGGQNEGLVHQQGRCAKIRRLFEAASQLLRRQQERIAAILEAIIADHASR